MQEVEMSTISEEEGMDGGGWLWCQTVGHFCWTVWHQS